MAAYEHCAELVSAPATSESLVGVSEGTLPVLCMI
jgi:hypothetical protein